MQADSATETPKSSRRFKFRQAIVTDVGLKREENQDSYGFAHTSEGSVYIVADGMGGARGGATASALGVESILRLAFELDGTCTQESLHHAIDQANGIIFEHSREDESLAGMGTTVVLFAASGDKALVAHVGDSRAYRYRNGRLDRLTRDHTLVQELLDSGAITAAEAMHHPIAHMLTRSLGPTGAVDIECVSLPEPVQVGDRYLLCCDGLYNVVATEEIAQALTAAGPDLDQAVKALLDLALERGGPDNITIELMEAVPADDPTVECLFPEPGKVHIFSSTSDGELLELELAAPTTVALAPEPVVEPAAPVEEPFTGVVGEGFVMRGVEEEEEQAPEKPAEEPAPAAQEEPAAEEKSAAAEKAKPEEPVPPTEPEEPVAPEEHLEPESEPEPEEEVEPEAEDEGAEPRGMDPHTMALAAGVAALCFTLFTLVVLWTRTREPVAKVSSVSSSSAGQVQTAKLSSSAPVKPRTAAASSAPMNPRASAAEGSSDFTARSMAASLSSASASSAPESSGWPTVNIAGDEEEVAASSQNHSSLQTSSAAAEEKAAQVAAHERAQVLERVLVRASDYSVPDLPVLRRLDPAMLSRGQPIDWVKERANFAELVSSLHGPGSSPKILADSERESISRRKGELREAISDLDAKLEALDLQTLKDVKDLETVLGDSVQEAQAAAEAAQFSVDTAKKSYRVWEERKKSLGELDPLRLADEVGVSSELVKQRKDEYQRALIDYREVLQKWQKDPRNAALVPQVSNLSREIKSKRAYLEQAVLSGIERGLLDASTDVANEAFAQQNVSRYLDQLNRHLGFVKGAQLNINGRNRDLQRTLLDDRRKLVTELLTLEQQLSDDQEASYRREQLLQTMGMSSPGPVGPSSSGQTSSAL